MATRQHREAFLEPLLTIQEAAEYLGISPPTLYSWRTRGRGPKGFRLQGGGVRYRRADLLDWLDQQAEKPSPAR